MAQCRPKIIKVMYKAPLGRSEELSGALFERLVSEILMNSSGGLGEDVTSVA